MSIRPAQEEGTDASASAFLSCVVSRVVDAPSMTTRRERKSKPARERNFFDQNLVLVLVSVVVLVKVKVKISSSP